MAADLHQRKAEARKLGARAHELMKTAKITESLAVSKSTVSAWRSLAAEEEQFVPELARSLGQLSMIANRVGQYDEALEAAVESVRLWRILVAENFAGWGFDLSQALMRMAPQLARSHWRESLAAREQGTQVLLRLLPIDEARYLLPTAQACLRLAELGGGASPQSARSYAEKAVELWRRLAERNLIEYGPSLIRALKRLSIEQLDPARGWGKAPLKEARRIKLARTLLLLRGVVRQTVSRLRKSTRMERLAKTGNV